MLKHLEGTNPDGTPHYRYELTQEELDQDLHLFVTGPVAGVVNVPAHTLENGQEIPGATYDVTDGAIPVHYHHIGHLHVEIHKMHHAAGNFTDHPVPALEDVKLPLREHELTNAPAQADAAPQADQTRPVE